MKVNKEKGISLIVLVITIIVIVILSGIIIVTMSSNGVVDRSKKARFMSDFRSIEDGVVMYSLSNAVETQNLNLTNNLPIETELSFSDKQAIIDSNLTLKAKIEELNPGETVYDRKLYWIDEPVIGVKLSNEKQEKGYIIDADSRQIYDYVGDVFENKRWHTLDSGVDLNQVPIGETLEMWDGWIKLNLFYPSDSTARQWRIGTQGETRVDPMLMWQNYTGPITIPLDRVKDVWIKYKIGNEDVTIPPEGTLLVDIIPDSTGIRKVDKVNIKINYDEASTTKEYRVGNSDWMPYVSEFTVTENCMIEARANKTETIYNTDGSILVTREISGKDKVYVGNIGVNPDDQVETPDDLAAPVITRLAAQNVDEKARVQITYPENAVKKVFKINYGVEQDYTSEVSISSYGTYVIAYYYDANGKKSKSTSILINDTTTGEEPEPPKPHEPLPPYEAEKPIPGTSDSRLPAPVITRLAAQNGNEKARVSITYPSQAVRNIYTYNYGSEQNYTSEISITDWGTTIIAYYYDENSKVSLASRIVINEVVTPEEPYPPMMPDPKEDEEDILIAPTINLYPDTSYTSEVSVSVYSPASAIKTYIKLGKYSDYQEYTGSLTVKQNMEVYAYYVTSEGKKSEIGHKIVSNIKQGNNPYVYINAVVYPWGGTFGQKDVTVTVQYSDVTKIEYSEDGIIYKPYTNSFKVTENKRIYARGTNANGVTETYLDITNIGQLKPPSKIQDLGISINADPEPFFSETKNVKVKISIEYDDKANEKYYSIGKYGELKTYTEPFEVTNSCTIYAYAKAEGAQGEAYKIIDNIIDGISDPIIMCNPSSNVQSSKVNISIIYDKYATIKKYSIDGDTLQNYNAGFEIVKNGSTIYAYSENSKGQKSMASYKVENIVPEPPVLLLDKGEYYLLKLNYPENSNSQEYKWKAAGEWKNYNQAGILLIKPQYKDTVVKNGSLIKIEDENGELIDFNGDYYLIDVPISQVSENLFMRWDRTAPSAPQIVISPTEATKQVTATIIYQNGLINKQYRIVNPGEAMGEWKTYDGPVIITRNNAVIYAKGMDDSEVWSSEAIYKVKNIDEVPPVINLTADLDTAQQKVSVKVNVTDDIAVGKVKWANGIQGESYFTNSGDEIVNGSIVDITENGYYTFYAEDQVGNKQVYTLNVGNVDKIAPIIEIVVNPENVIGLTTNVTINYGDSSIKQYKIGTNNAVWSNYTGPFVISSYTVLSNNWQNLDGTVTVYAKGKDIAGNEVIVQKKILSLDLDKPKSPVIESSSGYPILKSIGVKFDALTTITYDNRNDINNYYSLDNGATWLAYNGPFELSTGNVIAKSVKKTTTMEVASSLSISTPSDALKSPAFDKNDSTSVYSTSRSTTTHYIKVDDSMIGKNMRIYWGSGVCFDGYANIQPSTMYYLASDKTTVISSVVNSKFDAATDATYSIPNNTKWIKFTLGGGTSIMGMLAEIQPSLIPTIKADPTTPTKNNVTVTIISLLSEYTTKYSLNGTTWYTYTEPIIVTTNTTVYSKVIDSLGNESAEKTLTVANIDKAAPTVSYTINGSLNNLSTNVTVTDVGIAGINTSTLQYVWNTQNVIAPNTGWSSFTNGEKISKMDSTSGKYYLWIKAYDNVGNIVISVSNEFLCVKANPAGTEDNPGIPLTENSTISGASYNYNNPVIPAGFVAVNTPDASWNNISTDWNNGLVIQDISKNQFVWVPIDGSAVYYGKFVSNANVRDDTVPAGYNVSNITNKYKGFYIGRYESSVNGSKASIMKNKSVWNYIKYSSAKSYADTMAASYGYDATRVGTNLVTGAELDTTLRWIQNSGKNVLTDSKNWGNSWTSVSPADVTGYRYLQTSGYSEFWKAKNIYDISGNLIEWISETTYYYPTYAGGSFNDNLAAAARNYDNTSNASNVCIGFRIALIVK